MAPLRITPVKALLLGCLLLGIVSGIQGCPKKAYRAMKEKFDEKVESVKGPACFTIASMRTEGEKEGIYDDLGEQLNSTTCVKKCMENWHNGKMVALTTTECHCNKKFMKKGRSDLNKCNNFCPGNAKQRCGGGTDFISVYNAKATIKAKGD